VFEYDTRAAVDCTKSFCPTKSRVCCWSATFTDFLKIKKLDERNEKYKFPNIWTLKFAAVETVRQQCAL